MHTRTMVRSRITDALDRAMAEAGADREGLGAVAVLLVEDLAAWTTCAASTTVRFETLTSPPGMFSNVLLSPVYRMFQSNRMCPPWHTFSAYSKTDIAGGDIKEVNQYIVVGDCAYVLVSVLLQVHLLLAGLAADDIPSIFT